MTDFTLPGAEPDAAVLPGCGNGILEPGEVCDGSDLGDQTCASAVNRTFGELRCTEGCQLDVSDCNDCGNGALDPGETCDDGNATAGDGCSSSCVTEMGWACDTAEPSGCTPICGDGLVRGGETCDDGNHEAGDGCSDACLVEPGWSCHGEPSQCAETCGDGILDVGESCDDGNATAEDGCSPSCVTEMGWACDAAEPSGCSPICGDGLRVGAESCDDGNATAGDGCSPSCVTEMGWTCDAAEPSGCSPICGDGLVRGGETCDDGNATAGDGCSSSCVTEMGWACNAAEPSGCTPICGDGLLMGGESCDDGNATAGDGCSSTCHVEPYYACWGGTNDPSACVCVVYVDVDNTNGPQTGESWSSAFTSVVEGVLAARNQPIKPCEIWVAEGTYVIWQGSDYNVIEMDRDLALYGGFTGVETARSERAPETHVTVLDGQDPQSPANRVRTVVRVVNDPGVIINGFTITGGDSNGAQDRGGGITIRDSEVTVSRCRLVDNLARYGGAIFVRSSTVTVRRSVFLDNTATDYGGGIQIIYDSSVTVENSLFVRNQAGLGDGAVLNLFQCGHASCLVVTNSTITSNDPSAPAIYGSGDGDIVLRNSIVWENADPPLRADGTSTLTVSYSDISGGWPSTGNLSLDPLFVSPGTDDYHLQPGSPCIDAASSLVAPSTDLDGNPRVDDPNVSDTGIGLPPADMGAYERQP